MLLDEEDGLATSGEIFRKDSQGPRHMPPQVPP